MIKLFNLTNIEGFFKTVQKCKGNVYIKSAQGDCFNLKSNLTKYIAFTEILSNAKADELVLEVDNDEDNLLFINFMINQ